MTTATNLRLRGRSHPGRAKRRARWVAYAGVPALSSPSGRWHPAAGRHRRTFDAANSGLRSSRTKSIDSTLTSPPRS